MRAGAASPTLPSVKLHRVVKYPNAIQTYVGAPHTTGKTVMDATITFTPAR